MWSKTDRNEMPDWTSGQSLSSFAALSASRCVASGGSQIHPSSSHEDNSHPSSKMSPPPPLNHSFHLYSSAAECQFAVFPVQILGAKTPDLQGLAHVSYPALREDGFNAHWPS